MPFQTTILADSLSPEGVRLITFEATFPRFILAEFNTHRVLSRNSASSRAIPITKQIARVRSEPFVPIGFGTAKKGMVADADLVGWKSWAARQLWLKSRYAAIAAAKGLEWLEVHKAFANRLLEPWVWHTVIVTGTEWDNFFALRTDENAQPEFRIIAQMMKDAADRSKPFPVMPGEWHLPLVYPEDTTNITSDTALALISAGRCARVSFDTHHKTEKSSASAARADMLRESGHWSPFEHQAQAAHRDWLLEGDFDLADLNGNLSGDWIQFRKTFPHENNFAALKESLV